MQTYTVHEPPPGAGGRPDPVDAVLVKDGFTWTAFALAPLWLAWHRQWLWLAAYVAVMLALAGLVGLLGLHPEASSWLSLVVGLLLGFEAGNLRRRRLARQGFTEVGAVSGGNRSECELRYLLARSGHG